MKQPTKRGKNPLDKQGNITQCYNCYSINHWAENCPDQSTEEATPHEALYSVVLFEDDEDNPDNIKSLVFETMGCAVLDCGAAKSVCGNMWFKSYVDLLSEEDKKRMVSSDSISTFKFGNGNLVKALKSVLLPITLGKKKVMIQVEVVEEDIPLLFSRISMKRAKTQMDTSNDTVTMLGNTIKMITTSTGHYAIPICTNRFILESELKINLLASVPDMPIREIAIKLHRQFAHPAPERLIRLVEKSEYKSKELNQLIHEISESCIVCKRYKRPPLRPIVGMPLATRFNQTITMDIKFIKSKPVLHMIDSLSRFSVSVLLASKRGRDVLDSFFKNWVTIFGPPGLILTDNGGDFANHEFISL